MSGCLRAQALDGMTVPQMPVVPLLSLVQMYHDRNEPWWVSLHSSSYWETRKQRSESDMPLKARGRLDRSMSRSKARISL
eukprot:4181696-Alexandrium_andersonii.AAC.1